MARDEANPIYGVKEFESVLNTESSAVDAGEVIVLDSDLGNVGIAAEALDANEEGTYYIKGVFEFPIATGVTVSQFDACYWDVSENEIIKTSPAVGDPYLGYAVADGSAAGGYVRVAINEIANLVGSINLANEAVGMNASGSQSIVLQGDSVLDLTDNTSVTTLASAGAALASRGGDTVVPVKIYAYVTTEVAADSTAPIITVQDSSDNSTGLTLTLTDGDAANDIAYAELADGAAATAVNLTTEGLEVKVTTAAADAATAAGECKVLVECLLIK